MERLDYEVLRERFLKTVVNVPIPLRGQIIAVVDDKAVSWNAAAMEIKQNTPEAKSILEQLHKMGVI